MDSIDAKVEYTCEKCFKDSTWCDHQKCRNKICLFCSRQEVWVCRQVCQNYYCSLHEGFACELCKGRTCQDCITVEAGMNICKRCEYELQKS